MNCEHGQKNKRAEVRSLSRHPASFPSQSGYQYDAIRIDVSSLILKQMREHRW